MRFVVTGSDDSGIRARARTLPLTPGGLAEVKLPVFISRTDEFARPPGNLSTDPGTRPPFAFVGGRYLLLAGGSAGDHAQLDGYDFGAWLPVQAPPPLGCPSPPCKVRSIAVVKATLSLVIGDDWALSLDVDSGQSFSIDCPSGLPSWADVAGGATVIATDGSAYVVGATRRRSAHPLGRASRHRRQAHRSQLGGRADVAAAPGWPAVALIVLGGDDEAAGAERLPEAANRSMRWPLSRSDDRRCRDRRAQTARGPRRRPRRPTALLRRTALARRSAAARAAHRRSQRPERGPRFRPRLQRVQDPIPTALS